MLKVFSNIKKALWSEGGSSSHNTPANQVTVEGPVLQQHNGNGPNVVGVYNEYKDLKPEKVKQVAVNIFELVGRGDSLAAKGIIETIEITGSIGPDLRACVRALKIISGLSDVSEESDAHSELIRYYCEAGSPDERDVFLSLIIRLRVLLKKQDEAVEIFKAEEVSCQLARCQFFEFLASKEELSREASKSRLSDIEMLAVIKGCFREGNSETALRLAYKVKTTYETYEARIVYYIALAQSLSQDLKDRNYWLIEKKLKDSIEELFEPVISLIQESEGKDRRIFNIAVPLFSYTGSNCEELHELTWQYIEKWESNHPDFAAVLYAHEKSDCSRLEGVIKEAYLLSESQDKRKDFKDRFLGTSEVETEDLLLAIEHLDHSDLADWLEVGGRLSDDIDDCTRTFVSLLLITTIASNQFEIKNEVSDYIELLKTGPDFFVNANPLLTIKIISNLNRLGLYAEACQVLDGVLPQQDPWFSPLVQEYLVALYNSHQFLSFKAMMTKLHDDAEDFGFYWALKAHLQVYENDYVSALNSIDRALAIRKDFTRYLLQKCHIIVKLDRNVAGFLNSIDDSVFNVDDEDSMQLLAFMFHFCDFQKVEGILVNLFLGDPRKTSKVYSGLHFSYTLTKNGDDNIDPKPKNVGHAVQGFSYTHGRRQKKVIVVSGGSYTDSEYLIRADSPIGKALLNLEVGQVDKSFPQDIILHQKLEPYVAALQISCEIRHDLNDGSDAFHMLELPSDKSQLISAMQEHLQRLSVNKKDDMFSSPNIPLLMKGNAISSEEPVRAAVSLFTDPDIIKPIALDKGSFNIPDEFVVDVYTAVYVGLTGLSKAVSKRNFYITEQTRHHLQEFLNTITSDNYMSMGLDRQGRIFRTLKQDVESSYGFLVEGVKLILQSAKVSDSSSILHVDIPQELNVLKGGLDETVFYTILLSYSTSLPWLTIDNLIGGFASGYGVEICSMHALSSELAREVDLDDRVYGLGLHATGCLPLIPLHDDFRDLLLKFDVLSLIVLKDMLKKYSNFINESRELDFVLDAIPVYVSYKLERMGCLEAEALFRAAVSLFNTALRIQISRQTGQTAEYKMAQSIRQSYQKASGANYQPRILKPLYMRFIAGHFLSISIVQQHLREKDHEKLESDDV